MPDADKGYPCWAARDGDCIHNLCPQTLDGEPAKTGRHCPRDTLHRKVAGDDYYEQVR